LLNIFIFTFLIGEYDISLSLFRVYPIYRIVSRGVGTNFENSLICVERREN
jgi:hypothetical protein